MNTSERNETHHLRWDFTEDELREFSKTMAREAQDLTAAENQKKVATSQFAEEIARHRMALSQMARNISNGYEMRMTKCHVQLDNPERGRATIIREDTGEVVRERAMTDQEVRDVAQKKLPLTELPPTGIPTPADVTIARAATESKP